MTWDRLQQLLAERWRQGEHVTIIAPTGVGKTHLAVTLAEMSRHVLVLATKRSDPLVADLQAHGYLVTGDLDELLWAERQPVNPKVVYWPQFADEGARQAGQAQAMRAALRYADKTGGWTIIVDETMWMVDELRLERELNAAWYQGRTQGISVIACAQRPSRIPRLALSQASYLFIGKFADGRDIDTLREISSTIPKDVMINAMNSLSKERHEFLFVDVHRDELAITIAPPR